VIAEGSGLAVITATGRHTEIGRIRALVADTGSPPTPLEQQLDRTGRRLVGLSLGACAAALGLGVLRGVPLLEMARSAISLAVAAVPEGLPAVATTTLALGTQRMLRRGTLVRRLAAVESLGGVTVICADKTGTLTENRMTVDSWCIGRREYGQGPELVEERANDVGLAQALHIAVLCNEAELSDAGLAGRGSSTESALLVAARDAGLDYREHRQRHPVLRRRQRIEGDTWMGTVHATADGDLSWSRRAGGAAHPGRRCLDDGVERSLTAALRQELRAVNDRIAARGLRVLGLAYKTLGDPDAADYEGLVWVGLVALTDPIRPGVGDAIRACRAAGIRTILLTGDHARTAAAIFRELNLGGRAPVVFDASHVEELGPDTLDKLVRDVDVFARVSPADKYRIVRALQAGGEVVAMTGDGINDAAALRVADVGVAMGARGTDVARDVADVVLMTDDFDGIVTAIAQGRTIHTNISKALRFLLATNFSEILVTLAALAVGIPRPMSAIQFLWINLLSDVAPALALAMEPAEPDVMARRPRDPASPILSRPTMPGIAGDAGILAATTLGVHALALGRYGAGPRATTLAFSTLTSAQLLHAFTYRSRSRPDGNGSGRSVLAPVVAGTLGLQLAAMAVPPLRSLLGLTPLSVADWALVGGATMLPFALKELRRQGDTNGIATKAARTPNGHRVRRAGPISNRSSARSRARSTAARSSRSAAHLVRTTIVTALAGVQDVGAEVGTAAVAAVRGAIRAAHSIGGDLGAVVRESIRGTIIAAESIGGELVGVARSAAGGAVKATGDAGGDVATAARRAVEGTVLAAKELGVDVRTLAQSAAEGAMEAADRIGGAASRAVRATLSGTVAGMRSLVASVAPSAQPRRSPRASPKRSRRVATKRAV
jgi:Ca2+-transporting ATPase